MIQFLGRRITFILLVTIIIIFAAHLGMRMAGNSEASRPDYDLSRLSSAAWDETRAYVRSALRGEFAMAKTAQGMMRVDRVLKETYVNSLGLLLVSLAGASFLGTLIGTLAALIKKGQIVLPLLMLTILGVSVPSFFAGLMLRQGELLYLSVFGRPLVSMAGFGWDFKHMLMPVLVLAARPLAYLTRATFLSVSRAMEEDYIRTAFSKGLSLSRTVNIHALRNVAVPILTAIGVSLRFSLSALPIVEFFFLWPGMGLRLLEAINMRQTALVVTLAAALGLTFLVINFLLDIAYRFVDPRMRVSG